MPTSPEPSATDRSTVGASERVFKLLSATAFKSLNTEIDKAEKRKDDAGEAVTKQLNEAKSDKGLHKGAYRDIRKLMKRDPQKLEEYLVHFDHMRKLAGLDELAGLQGKLDGVKPAPGAPEGEQDVRPQFLKDKTAGREPDAAKH